MNAGKIWLGVRCGSFSMATTLPMLGAIDPSAAAGFRPICDHVCASECTSAHALIDRTIARSPRLLPSLGKIPAGQLTPLIIVGFRFGDDPAAVLRSNVSHGLMAPVS